MFSPDKIWYQPPSLQEPQSHLPENIFSIDQILYLFPDMPALFSPDREPALINFYPQNFQEIKGVTLSLQAFDLTIPRTQWMQKLYAEFRRKLKKYGANLNDFIRQEYLGNDNLAILPDAFPYDVPADTAHYDFWVGHPGFGNELLAEYLGQFLTACEVTPEDVVVVEKPPTELRHRIIQPSVPGVRHMHLFMRRK